jgi:site-specific recombinase XerD
LGHADIRTTEIYLSVSDADIAQAYKKFAPMANLLAGHKAKAV